VHQNLRMAADESIVNPHGVRGTDPG